MGYERLKVGVIGVGQMGELHARILSQMPTSELVAVVDINPERADIISRDLGVEGYNDYRKLLERDDIQAVSICTPDQIHLEPAVAAAEAGKHILIEKPLATSSQDAQAIIEAAKKAEVKLMVGHVLRFDPRYVRARDIVQNGELGDIVHIVARRNNLISNGRRIGGRTSVLFYLGVHDIDIMRWCIASEITKVYAESCSKALTDLGVEDTVLTTMRFQNGAIANLEVSWIMPDWSISTLDARLEIVGTEGSIFVHIRDQGLQIFTKDLQRFLDTTYLPPVHNEIVGILRDEIAHFVKCVLEDREPLISGEEGKKAVEVVEAMTTSLRTGMPVEL